MFSTKNVKEISIICFKEQTNKVLNLLINQCEFQFKSVEENELINHCVINSELVNKINDLIERLNNLIKSVKQVVVTKPLVLKHHSINDLESEVIRLERSKLTVKVKRQALVLRELLSNELSINMLYNKIGEQDGVNLIQGWIPSINEKKFISKVRKISDDVLVEIKEPLRDAPVILSNKFPFKPFELLTRFYSAPEYGSIDPTPIFAVTFTLCFGLMFSDVIDGLIISVASLIGYYIRKNDFFMIGFILGLSVIFFGFLFGEAMGGLIDLKPLWFDPFNNPLHLLFVALFFGSIHIVIGHLIGLINDVKRGESFKGLSNHLSFIIMLVGVALLFKSQLIGVITIVIGVGLLMVGRDAKSIVELPSIIGNLISYSRILAINMAHAGIARAFETLSLSFNNLLLSILIISFGQLIILTLDLVVAFIHSLRLHFVEFFTKFMGNGDWFMPYKSKKLYIIK